MSKTEIKYSGRFEEKKLEIQWNCMMKMEEGNLDRSPEVTKQQRLKWVSSLPAFSTTEIKDK